MAVLCTADAVFRALREHALGRLVLEDDDEDGSGSGSGSGTSGHATAADGVPDGANSALAAKASGAGQQTALGGNGTPVSGGTRPEGASDAVSDAEGAEGASGQRQEGRASSHGAASTTSAFKLEVGVAGTPEIDGANELIQQAKT